MFEWCMLQAVRKVDKDVFHQLFLLDDSTSRLGLQARSGNEDIKFI